MKKLIPAGAFCLLAVFVLTVFNAAAQEQGAYQVGNITRVNLGDGRWLHRTLDGETPLEGHHRIIDGYRSEYIEADFVAGLYDGEYEHYKNNVLIEKGTYKEGRKEGLFSEYLSSSGSLKQESEYTAGKIDGLVRTFFADGSVATEKGYKNGREHGPDRRFDYGEPEPRRDFNFFEGEKDGRQMSRVVSNQGDYTEVIHYNRGVKAGEFLQTWQSSGAVKTRGFYEGGKEHGVWTYGRSDGTTESEVSFRDGKRHGESRIFFPNGSLERITEYADDKRHGVEKSFGYSSGRLTSEYTYSNSYRDGPYKLYFDDGKLREEGQFKNGNQLYRKMYYRNGQVEEVMVVSDYYGRWETVERYNEDGSVAK
jgi:antitoxin component YwqK of YwqJK toxin-antitoxin module